MVHLRWTKLGVELGMNSDGVIAHEDLAQLLTLQESIDQILAQAQHELDQAHEEAKIIRQRSYSEALETSEKTESKKSASTRLGYWQGHQQAVQDWNNEAQNQRYETLEILSHQRHRMAEIVVKTVRGLVLSEPSINFYQTALSLLDKEIEASSQMVMMVHPIDGTYAQEALDSMSKKWPLRLFAKIEIDADLAPRSCRVETDIGYLDASLDTQLKALERYLKQDAAARPLNSLANVDDVDLNDSETDHQDEI